jgi:hypothetical protein
MPIARPAWERPPVLPFDQLALRLGSEGDAHRVGQCLRAVQHLLARLGMEA